MYEALVAIQEEMGGESAMEIAYTENMFDVTAAAQALRDYADEGYNLIIAHGTQYGTSLFEHRAGLSRHLVRVGNGDRYRRRRRLDQRLRLSGERRTGRLCRRRDGRDAEQDRHRSASSGRSRQATRCSTSTASSRACWRPTRTRNVLLAYTGGFGDTTAAAASRADADRGGRGRADRLGAAGRRRD